jgi:hypothetical protein
MGNNPYKQLSEGAIVQPENSFPAAVAAAERVISAADLKEEQWKHILTKQTEVMHGVVLGTGRASDDQGPKRALHPLVSHRLLTAAIYLNLNMIRFNIKVNRWFVLYRIAHQGIV